MKKLYIVGLGAGDLDQIPLGVYRLLKSGKPVFLRTKEHPVVSELEKEGFQYHSFDSIYEKNEQFEAVYEEICETLLSMKNYEELIYGVPGHPLVAERTVQLLLKRGKEVGIELEVIGGQSFLDDIFTALHIDPIEGFQLLDATDLKLAEIQLRQHILIGQVYDSFMASNVKLTFMERLPYNYDVYIVTAAGSKEESIRKVPLVELDRETELSNLTSVYIPPVTDDTILYKDFNKLRAIIAELRGPNGCPWDLKQTHESLKKYLIEETYEVIEAIQEGDIDHLVEELGDVLLQILLHAQIGEDDGYFSIDDVIEGLSAKMVRRHPHVFGDRIAETAEDVVKNWQEIKQEEKGEKPTSILGEVGTSLPTILRAFELQKKAAKVGFDWPDVSGAWEKLKEEIGEFEQEIKDGSNEQAVKEFGDILFALVNIARFYDINPDEALFMTNQKFIRRFHYIEEKVEESGKPFTDYQLKELDHFWDEAKKAGL
ncbi:bifunctional methyltransferase/pyrophosphohydrolase YabN [Niallia endozanthoxylica]|uniref:Nucleoside triphosphate pyrophosphohydrolase n=1 Tax=Niallia endozanthoxylica TaxID=2036016 RepID=A0A5J5GUS7_9BACI|nr:nucleoside triphosphate pyrophosphohydrolase [Niallia endozanthoxylica]KAA9012000.1 nucleoside triphosphate pyrophosphohydrolase [Niallia endozanthoxylica]